MLSSYRYDIHHCNIDNSCLVSCFLDTGTGMIFTHLELAIRRLLSSFLDNGMIFIHFDIVKRCRLSCFLDTGELFAAILIDDFVALVLHMMLVSLNK